CISLRLFFAALYSSELLMLFISCSIDFFFALYSAVGPFSGAAARHANGLQQKNNKIIVNDHSQCGPV
ncbi:MAG: hypothetical protein IIY74_03815, partial [Firmicutes bacterium]|nr:hypothetical protein [Bacillota bacterium]